MSWLDDFNSVVGTADDAFTSVWGTLQGTKTTLPAPTPTPQQQPSGSVGAALQQAAAKPSSNMMMYIVLGVVGLVVVLGFVLIGKRR